MSPGFGPLGLVVEGSPRLLTTPGPRHCVPIGPRLDEVRVGVVPMALGDDGTLLGCIGGAFDGLVLAGVGAMLTRTYSYPGSELDLIGRGLIPSGFLDPYKARILLHLLLSTTSPRDTITATFEHFG